MSSTGPERPTLLGYFAHSLNTGPVESRKLERGIFAVGTGPLHMAADADETLIELFELIEKRKETLPEESYTTELLTHEKGRDFVLEKLGEETTEFVLAAKADDQDAILHEGADIVYHLLVALAVADLTVEDLYDELQTRRE